MKNTDMTETELSIVMRIQSIYGKLVKKYGTALNNQTDIEILLRNKEAASLLFDFLVNLDLLFTPPKKFLGLFQYHKNEFFASPQILELSPILPRIFELMEILIKVDLKLQFQKLLDPALVINILEGIGTWNEIKETKITPFERGNIFLQKLPLPPSSNTFYAYVKELNPKTTLKCKHPLNEKQLLGQRQRSTEELIKYDNVDPIIGVRFFRLHDTGNAPGSGILVEGGHHRLYELYRRYLQGELSGEERVLFRRFY